MGDVRRRAVLIRIGSALVAGCEPGKLTHSIEFELQREGWNSLDSAIQAFALQNGFKVDGAVSPVPDNEYWPYWSLLSESIEISVGPAGPPEEGDTAAGPFIYAARFYDTSNAPTNQRMVSVIAAFSRSLGSVEGIRKLEGGS